MFNPWNIIKFTNINKNTTQRNLLTGGDTTAGLACHEPVELVTVKQLSIAVLSDLATFQESLICNPAFYKTNLKLLWDDGAFNSLILIGYAPLSEWWLLEYIDKAGNNKHNNTN